MIRRNSLFIITQPQIASGFYAFEFEAWLADGSSKWDRRYRVYKPEGFSTLVSLDTQYSYEDDRTEPFTNQCTMAQLLEDQCIVGIRIEAGSHKLLNLREERISGMISGPAFRTDFMQKLIQEAVANSFVECL